MFPHCPSPAAGTFLLRLGAAETRHLWPEGLAVAAEPWNLKTGDFIIFFNEIFGA